MTSPDDPQPVNDPYWYDYLTKGDPMERRVRRVFTHIPRGPRCKICAAPFGGPGAPFMRAIGKRPSDKNPAMCNSCFVHIAKHRGGAEIEASFLFADIRGSTALAEGMSPSEFRALVDRFYVAASTAVFDHDGGVDKFVGDEIVAFFFPLVTGARHAAKAIEAATAILRGTGHDDPGGPWVPVGAGSRPVRHGWAPSVMSGGWTSPRLATPSTRRRGSPQSHGRARCSSRWRRPRRRASIGISKRATLSSRANNRRHESSA